jgi:hypothetical protein
MGAKIGEKIEKRCESKRETGSFIEYEAVGKTQRTAQNTLK